MPQRFRMGIVLISPGAVQLLQTIAGHNFWYLAAALITRHENGGCDRSGLEQSFRELPE